MNEVTFYNNSEFGTLRQLSIEGEPWFVGKDVAEALGYTNTRDALKKHVDDEDKMESQIATPSRGLQKIITINESGVYSLIFSSKLEGAKRFKRWVTNEVLPAIRKNGCYIQHQSAARLPVKDYNYWISLPEDADDFQKLLEQERAKIGAQEARRRARARAVYEYKEYHANSPFLVGTSSAGYDLTDEAEKFIEEYLQSQDMVKIFFIYRHMAGVDRSPTDAEVNAIQNYLLSTRQWEPLPCKMIEAVRDKFRFWQRTQNLIEIE